MDVEIFVKPGCVNNKKQVKMLEEKGHHVIVKDIFTIPWNVGTLQKFFADIPFEKWINPTAPRIKRGEVDLAKLTPQNAISEMVKDNYLIKRPLLIAGGVYASGFDSALATELMKGADVSDVLNCPQLNNKCD